MITNDILKSIRLLSIGNVQSSTIEWYIELAYRHYSKTYHTPLHVAKSKITQLEAVQIMMEDEMLEMSKEDIDSMKKQLQKLPQPMLNVESYYNEEVVDQEMDDEEWVAQQIAQLQEKEKSGKKEVKKDAGPSMADAAMQAQQAIKGLYDKINQPAPKDGQGDIKFNIKE